MNEIFSPNNDNRGNVGIVLASLSIIDISSFLHGNTDNYKTSDDFDFGYWFSCQKPMFHCVRVIPAHVFYLSIMKPANILMKRIAVNQNSII